MGRGTNRIETAENAISHFEKKMLKIAQDELAGRMFRGQIDKGRHAESHAITFFYWSFPSVYNSGV